MPNIAITNRCNLHCPYCFANDFINQQQNEITLEQLKNILKFLERTPPTRIGIIGGEPTIHPNIQQILSEVKTFANYYGCTIAIFTNGINLNPILNDIDNITEVLINVNEPARIGEQNWYKIEQNILYLYHKGLGNQVKFGINLFLEI